MDSTSRVLDDEAGFNPMFAAFVACVALATLGLAALSIGALLDASADTPGLVASGPVATHLNALGAGLEVGSAAAIAVFGGLALAVLGLLVVRGLRSDHE